MIKTKIRNKYVLEYIEEINLKLSKRWGHNFEDNREKRIFIETIEKITKKKIYMTYNWLDWKDLWYILIKYDNWKKIMRDIKNWKNKYFNS